jgi:tetratricopeptide (TPR) repeat protein
MNSVEEMSELLSRFREDGKEHQVANLAFKLGDIYREKGEFERALPLLEEAHALCIKYNNAQGESLVSLALGELHLASGHAEQAEILANRAYHFCAKADDVKGRVRASLLLGDIHWSREDPGRALVSYREAMELCSTFEDVLGCGILLDRIAKMHRMLEEDEKALSYFQEALLRWEKLGVSDRQAMTLANLGDLCKKKGDLAKAIFFHEQAVGLYRQLKDLPAVDAIEQELQTLRPQQREQTKDL